MTVRVLLVDDHAVVREGIKALIEKSDGMEVVAEAANGTDAVELAAKLKPDVVVMDVAMAGLNGIEATSMITKSNPEIKVVGLSIHTDRKFMKEMLTAGAMGYVIKNEAFRNLENAIGKVCAGKTYVSGEVAETILDEYAWTLRNGSRSRNPELSRRELEILRLYAEGFSTKEISAKCRLSSNTVDTHRKNFMKKLGFRSIADIVKYAIRERIITFESGESLSSGDLSPRAASR